MRAVVIDKITPAERIEITDIPVPKVKSGWVLIKVKAFGLNHSEKKRYAAGARRHLCARLCRCSNGKGRRLQSYRFYAPQGKNELT